MRKSYRIQICTLARLFFDHICVCFEEECLTPLWKWPDSTASTLGSLTLSLASTSSSFLLVSQRVRSRLCCRYVRTCQATLSVLSLSESLFPGLKLWLPSWVPCRSWGPIGQLCRQCVTCGWRRVKVSRPCCCSSATCSQHILWIQPSTLIYQGMYAWPAYLSFSLWHWDIWQTNRTKPPVTVNIIHTSPLAGLMWVWKKTVQLYESISSVSVCLCFINSLLWTDNAPVFELQALLSLHTVYIHTQMHTSTQIF